jgi:predicted DNA-binding transcriptional regulator YafY
MRAARLLQMLLLLQNRGRMTSARLAAELEVTRRTILRDVDALTEAGLPIVVHQGNQGGIELGFNYRTRLTGLAADEAEAIALVLTWPIPELARLGVGDAAERGRSKLLESFPDPVREKIALARRRFPVAPATPPTPDPRLPALAEAVRQSRVVRIHARSKSPRAIHPIALAFDGTAWSVNDALTGEVIAVEACGDLNISASVFHPGARAHT